MKKILIFSFIFITTLVFVLPIKAYNEKPDDVIIYNLNATIVFGDNVGTDLYRFDVQITKPSNTARYILFSTIIRDDVYYSTYTADYGDIADILTSPNDRFSNMRANNYMYFVRTAPMWYPTATNLLGVSFYVRSTSGVNAQLIVQDLIENYMYLYADNINTNESAVVGYFFERYNTDNYNAGFNDGYARAKSELYLTYYGEGYDDAKEYYAYCDENGYCITAIAYGDIQFTNGELSASDFNLDLLRLITQGFASMWVFAMTIFSVSIAGIKIFEIIGLMITIVIAVMFIRIVFR